jgi:hypothetical protein
MRDPPQKPLGTRRLGLILVVVNYSIVVDVDFETRRCHKTCDVVTHVVLLLILQEEENQVPQGSNKKEAYECYDHVEDSQYCPCVDSPRMPLGYHKFGVG